MLNKQGKERLTAAEHNYWKDESMVKHCVNNAMLLFDLRGKIVIIEKTAIKTDFCFGRQTEQALFYTREPQKRSLCRYYKHTE